MWVDLCFARDWWFPAVARMALAADGADDAIEHFTAALRTRLKLDAEEVHRSLDLEYKWARQKLGKALRKAEFSQGRIVGVRWAAPPGRELVLWHPAEHDELGVLTADRAGLPDGKQAKAHWLVDRWRAHLQRRAQIWRVTHVLKVLEDPGVVDDPVEIDDWYPEEVLAKLTAELGPDALHAGLGGADPGARRRIADVLLDHASDEADVYLKLAELVEVHARGEGDAT
jgi:hypothetical protein